MSHSDLELLSSAQAKGAKGVAGLPVTVTNQDALLEADLEPLATRAKYATYKYYLLAQLRGGSQKECADKCFPESSDIGALHRKVLATCKSIEPLESIQPAPTRTVFQCTTIPAKRADDPPQEKHAATESTIRRWKKADLELWTDGSVKGPLTCGSAAILYSCRP
jgi:hypothetical protein